MSYRISLTLACPMDLKLYPLDRQECEMRIASCKFFFPWLLRSKKTFWTHCKECFKLSDGWTTADLIYKWKELDPVQIVNDLNLPRFKLERFSTEYCNTKTNTGKNYFTMFENTSKCLIFIFKISGSSKSKNSKMTQNDLKI